jgi:hypothetical protein
MSNQNMGELDNGSGVLSVASIVYQAWFKGSKSFGK